MAEGAPRALTAAFPPPPPFWKHFTPENIEKLEQIKKESSKSKEEYRKKKWSPAELQALKVPPELGYLIPPEAPKSGSYSVFGETQSISTTLPSLKEQGIEQLYPSPPATDAGKDEAPSSPPLNHAYYLLKISKSLLLNFLEFVGILSVAPEQFEPKLEDLRNLFINAHHLLNLYRPHQARESLILMMEEQLDRTREEIREMDRLKDRIEQLLQQLKTDGMDVLAASQSAATDATKNVEVDDKTVEEARQLWALVNEDEDRPR
ncbi:hypothetical protein VTN77DRAFT_9759 [Rasamsonia byssochlamydoides]|uniref:uncharacterized protein n=1 Tax=Rasamsonia byssochlamydoides TaxID=89139 RepID=UPI0037428EAB